MSTPASPTRTSPPTPHALVSQLSFPDALRAVIAGQRVTKLEWGNPNIFLHHADGFLRIVRGDKDIALSQISAELPPGYNDALIISTGDLLGEDWVIVHDRPLS